MGGKRGIIHRYSCFGFEVLKQLEKINVTFGKVPDGDVRGKITHDKIGDEGESQQ